MSWRRLMRALWPFGRYETNPASADAIAAAGLSHARAVEDHRKATAQREVAEILAEQVRGHNVANRYDEWLGTVMRGKR